jgi:hypothetical protein
MGVKFSSIESPQSEDREPLTDRFVPSASDAGRSRYLRDEELQRRLTEAAELGRKRQEELDKAGLGGVSILVPSPRLKGG